MKDVRVIVADPQPLTRLATSELLKGTSDIAIVGEAESTEETIRQAEELKPHVLILEIDMGKSTEISILRSLKESGVRILILSNLNSEQYVSEALRHGVYGYLTKDVAPERILEAVRGVCNEERGWFTHNVAACLATRFEGNSDAGRLTSRERDVLLLIADGHTSGEIALRLSISEKTARNHVSHILKKLKAKTRAHAIAQGFRGGYLAIADQTLRLGHFGHERSTAY